MATVSSSSSSSPVLSSTIEGNSDNINSVSAIVGDDSVISASDDKLVAVKVVKSILLWLVMEYIIIKCSSYSGQSKCG